MPHREPSSFEEVLDHLKTVAPGLADHLQRVDETMTGQIDDTADGVAGEIEPNIQDFTIYRKIGEGGFGTVWLAKNNLDRQLCALKTLAGEKNLELEGIREFKRRANGHPNLIPIGHVGSSEDNLFYVMPLADDCVSAKHLVVETSEYEPMTLEALIDQNGLIEPEEILAISKQILNGLHFLHATGAVHRDIKPANILRINGTWCLGDPGLLAVGAKATGKAGTAGFISPNAKSGRDNDLFAFGKTLFLMLTGKSMSAFDDCVSQEPSGTRIERQIGKVIRRACNKDTSKRYRSSREIKRALQPLPIRWPWLTVSACIVLGLAAIAIFGPRRSNSEAASLIGTFQVLAVHDELQYDVMTENGVIPNGHAYRVDANFVEPCYPLLFCLEPSGNAYEIFPYNQDAQELKQLVEPRAYGGFPVLEVGRYVIVLLTSHSPHSSEARKSLLGEFPKFEIDKTTGAWCYSDGQLRRGLQSVTRQVRPKPVAFAKPKLINRLIEYLEEQEEFNGVSMITFESR